MAQQLQQQLPPHLCHDQRGDDHCKDSIVAYTKKTKMAGRPLP